MVSSLSVFASASPGKRWSCSKRNSSCCADVRDIKAVRRELSMDWRGYPEPATSSGMGTDNRGSSMRMCVPSGIELVATRPRPRP